MNPSIIIHLYFLTEFEVLFYIFYIMPYEKKMILKLFDFNEVNTVSTYNISYNDNGSCLHDQHRLDEDNQKLWQMCLYYIIAINVIMFLVFCNDMVQMYKQFNESPKSKQYNSNSSLMSFGSANNLSLSDYKKNDESGIELRPFTPTRILDAQSFTGGIVNTALQEEPKEIHFFPYYLKKSIFVAEFCKTVQFIILVSIFEYVFFVTIINKYKIINTKIIFCKLLHENI